MVDQVWTRLPDHPSYGSGCAGRYGWLPSLVQPPLLAENWVNAADALVDPDLTGGLRVASLVEGNSADLPAVDLAAGGVAELVDGLVESATSNAA